MYTKTNINKNVLYINKITGATPIPLGDADDYGDCQDEGMYA